MTEISLGRVSQSVLMSRPPDPALFGLMISVLQIRAQQLNWALVCATQGNPHLEAMASRTSLICSPLKRANGLYLFVRRSAAQLMRRVVSHHVRSCKTGENNI